MQKISHLYQKLYELGKRLPKRERFGIWQKIENICLEILELAIAAAYEEGSNKTIFLKQARIKIEILKNLLRNCCEVRTLDDKNYLFFSVEIITISKMVSGWIKYLTP